MGKGETYLIACGEDEQGVVVTVECIPLARHREIVKVLKESNKTLRLRCEHAEQKALAAEATLRRERLYGRQP